MNFFVDIKLNNIIEQRILRMNNSSGSADSSADNSADDSTILGNMFDETTIQPITPSTVQPIESKKNIIQCIICQEKIADSGEVQCTPCMHVYHKKCLDQWIEACIESGRFPCPTCKYDISEIVSEYSRTSSGGSGDGSGGRFRNEFIENDIPWSSYRWNPLRFNDIEIRASSYANDDDDIPDLMDDASDDIPDLTNTMFDSNDNNNNSSNNSNSRRSSFNYAPRVWNEGIVPTGNNLNRRRYSNASPANESFVERKLAQSENQLENILHRVSNRNEPVGSNNHSQNTSSSTNHPNDMPSAVMQTLTDRQRGSRIFASLYPGLMRLFIDRQNNEPAYAPVGYVNPSRPRESYLNANHFNDFITNWRTHTNVGANIVRDASSPSQSVPRPMFNRVFGSSVSPNILPSIPSGSTVSSIARSIDNSTDSSSVPQSNNDTALDSIDYYNIRYALQHYPGAVTLSEKGTICNLLRHNAGMRNASESDINNFIAAKLRELRSVDTPTNEIDYNISMLDGDNLPSTEDTAVSSASSSTLVSSASSSTSAPVSSAPSDIVYWNFIGSIMEDLEKKNSSSTPSIIRLSPPKTPVRNLTSRLTNQPRPPQPNQTNGNEFVSSLFRMTNTPAPNRSNVTPVNNTSPLSRILERLEEERKRKT